MRRQWTDLVLPALVLLLAAPAFAGGAREAQGDAWFDAIMNPQNKMGISFGRGNAAYDMPVQAAEQLARPARRSAHPMPAASPVTVSGGAVIPGVTLQTEGPEVEVPLDEYSKIRDRLQAVREKAGRNLGPAVVLGASEFSGRAIKGALSLRVKLQVTLGRPGLWKTVPLIGDDVVLVRAAQSEGGARLPVSRRNGYHVWVTQQTGEKTIDLEILVPARGPRGSIEYDFLVARTPVMRFACRFPVPGLEPRLDAAVESKVRSEGGQTLLDASLRPTTHIHLVGFRDLGEDEGQAAKVYSESLNLLSIDEGALDLFTVIRYTILYAGTKEFQIVVPEGLDVVSADGEGAFRFALEPHERGTLLKGETAFPIRNNYEISLRLHREMQKKGESFDVPLPRCLGVERETGWLGVEVPGKLKLEEAAREQVAAVDVRQIPPEMVHSAVSPILKAYRYHTTDARIRLTGTRLPEKEPEAGSVDRMRVFTVVSPEGKVLSDVRITLRNRLMHSLALTLPEGTEVRSTHLDGQPVKPSRDEQGRLLLPLKRSTGRDRLRPFTLQLVLESDSDALGLIGQRRLVLPSVELPVSSLAWSVYLPARNLYTRLEGDIERQLYAGQARWQRPLAVGGSGYRGPVGTAAWSSGSAAAGAEAAVSAGDSGAMPVRIKLPRSGTRLEYSRYWIEKAQPVAASLYYVRGWLRIPAWIVLAALYALALTCLFRQWSVISPRLSSALGLAGLVLLYWPLYKTGGSTGIELGLLGGLLILALLRGWPRRVIGAVGEWAQTLGPRFREREKAEPLSAGALAWKILCGIFMGVFGLILLVSGLRFVALLFNPL